ncbi:MAG: PorT family protein [Bacteroidales bacterium]|nr:PorT family protein [Bacteroidales bacterium]
MKKIVFLSALMILGYYTFGQLGLGIKGAVTMSSLTTDLSEIKEAAKLGYQFGAFVRVGDKFHIQPEVYFTAKKGDLEMNVVGADPDNPLKSVEVSQGITLNTVDVPILLGYKILDPPLLNIRLQAGPVASIVTSKKFNVTFDGVDADEDQATFCKDDLKDINWGLQFGAGVDVLFLTIDLRYELGLSNLYNQPDNAVDGSVSEFKNNVFFLTVGWKIM